ncbi:hypothetical protein CTAYLR_006337 [Chrysophaeum taylorii]|uniref:Thioesterase domain-containing protein n=1 Tax=Chrysophaeum taylorii TaxID=2483200 RepID=A0AAD7U9X1_9STRA|nr:hypothetical protein CTAYLR_006337 [Chrysophaeum taylorii]
MDPVERSALALRSFAHRGRIADFEHELALLKRRPRLFPDEEALYDAIESAQDDLIPEDLDAEQLPSPYGACHHLKETIHEALAFCEAEKIRDIHAKTTPFEAFTIVRAPRFAEAPVEAPPLIEAPAPVEAPPPPRPVVEAPAAMLLPHVEAPSAMLLPRVEAPAAMLLPRVEAPAAMLLPPIDDGCPLTELYQKAASCGQRWADVAEILWPRVATWAASATLEEQDQDRDRDRELAAEACFLFARALANNQNKQGHRLAMDVCVLALEWCPAHKPARRMLKRLRATDRQRTCSPPQPEDKSTAARGRGHPRIRPVVGEGELVFRVHTARFHRPVSHADTRVTVSPRLVGVGRTSFTYECDIAGSDDLLASTRGVFVRSDDEPVPLPASVAARMRERATRPSPDLDIPATTAATRDRPWTTTVRASDADALGHVNNSKWGLLVADALEAAYPDLPGPPKALSLEYVRPALPGDDLYCRAAYDATANLACLELVRRSPLPGLCVRALVQAY